MALKYHIKLAVIVSFVMPICLFVISCAPPQSGTVSKEVKQMKPSAREKNGR